MSFNGKYIEWNQKRIKGIIDFYGHKFFYCKKILDLGCGYADISGALLRLGSDITAVDARNEHLKIVNKKYAEIKTIKADIDRDWPLTIKKKYDIILDLDLLCHINDFEKHIRQVCANTSHLILETAVCDSDNPYKCTIIAENKNNYDLSFNGNGSYPSAAAIERVLKECGMDFRRLDNNKFNSGPYKYDWQEKNSEECNSSNRRIWFAVSSNSKIQFNPIPRPKLKTNEPVPIKTNESASDIEVDKILPVPDVLKEKINLENKVNLSDKKFVIVIPSYKNEKWCIKNIESTIYQSYDNYRVIFTDDCSPD